MKKDRARQVAVNLQKEISQVYDELRELEQLREVRDAVETMSSATRMNQRDRDVLDQEIVGLEKREAFLRSRFKSGRERLIPLFEMIASWELNSADSEDWAALEDRFNKALQALIQVYIMRIEQRVRRTNQTTEELLKLSQVLPANDSEQDMLKFPGVATRIGPNVDGRYTGIRVDSREVHLTSVEDQVSSHLAKVREYIDELAESSAAEARKDSNFRDGLKLQTTPFFMPEHF